MDREDHPRVDRVATGDWLLILDFDGTVTMDDVGVAVLVAFSAPGWEKCDDDYEEGRISLAECIRQQFGMLRVSREELCQFARERAEIRFGLRDLLVWCRDRGIAVQILSGGLDVYIEEILRRDGLTDLFDAVHAVRTSFTDGGLDCRLPVFGASGSESDDYKRSYVELVQAGGRRVAFAGDGSNDRAAAAVADRAYATGSLLRYCRRNGVSVVPFETFYDILSDLWELVGKPD